jgi:hypothetical protein
MIVITGLTENLSGNCSGQAGLKEGADVEWSPRKKPEPSHRKVMLQAQPSEGRKGDTPLGCSERTALRREQCGLFTSCKNCNIETCSRDYATVDEAVFSPSRAEPSRAESRSYKHLDNARVGKDHVTASAVTQQLKRFPACQIKGL